MSIFMFIWLVLKIMVLSEILGIIRHLVLKGPKRLPYVDKDPYLYPYVQGFSKLWVCPSPHPCVGPPRFSFRPSEVPGRIGKVPGGHVRLMIYVCFCIYIYVYLYIHIYTYRYVYIQIYIHRYIYIGREICIYIYIIDMYIYICIYVCIYIYISILHDLTCQIPRNYGSIVCM